MAATDHDLDLPPVPERRDITPAPEDFAAPPPLGRLLWPLAWFGLAVGLVLLVVRYGWHPFAH
jgi:hypothetical protein